VCGRDKKQVDKSNDSYSSAECAEENIWAEER
jgi:hypothetical protein